MNNLIITKEKVIEAANKCSTAKDVLKTLFPEAFKEGIIYDEWKIYAFCNRGNIYKLHRIGADATEWAFISMQDSECWAAGQANTAEEIIERSRHNSIKIFNHQKEFFKWALEQV